MSLVTSALQIGKSALLAYQSGLQVVSNNIANLGSDRYVRQSPVMSPVSGSMAGGSSIGGSVVVQLRRNVDEALNTRLRTAFGDKESALAEQSSLSQIESLLNPLNDANLSSQMDAFFNSWSDLQNNPEDQGIRGIVLTQGSALAESFRNMRSSLAQQHESLNQQIEQTVEEINTLASQLGDVNLRISQEEMGGTAPASMLRDQRDAILSDLSKLVAVQTREQPDGSLNVYIGNEPLVQRADVRLLTSTRETVNGVQTTVIRWEDNGKQVVPWGGKLDGLMTSRDTHLDNQISSLDRLAIALISDVNRVHSSGQGLEGYSDLIGASDVLDANAALGTTDNGLPYVPGNGGFLFTVTNGTTQEQTTTRIDVDLDGAGADTTLASLAAAIDAVDGVSAQVTADNKLRITAEGGRTFTFGEDTSGVLGALGINTFFSGSDASTIGLDSNIAGQPSRLAAGSSNLAGDGSNAGRISALATSPSSYLNNGQSVLDFYNAQMTELGTTTAAAKNAYEASDVIQTSLESQWESVSGVNLDEETLMMMRYQRAFQGAARIVSVVDELIQQVLTMTG